MQPLADLLRPVTLNRFVGQQHLVGKGKPIRAMIDSGKVFSMIFWGPPASGKTTLARIIAKSVSSDFIELSAVMSGKKELIDVVEQAKTNHFFEKATIVFVDEIHRWNRAQQDALLPHVESGLIVLIGATTENPSFTITSALLSRARVFIFEQHSEEDIFILLCKGRDLLSLDQEVRVTIEDRVLRYLASLSNGDPRFALNSLQIAVTSSNNGSSLTKEEVESAANKFLRHDKQGEEHYTIISAVHKALRSSNATGAVYWIARMLEAGEDPLYIARRLIRFASEDIGNSVPTALVLANSVYDTCAKLGMPECSVALTQLAEYLAKAPKNNSAYIAWKKAQSDVHEFGNLSVPLHLRNAPTKLMKDSGYGKGYEYDHDLENKQSKQQIMPDALRNRKYF